MLIVFQNCRLLDPEANEIWLVICWTPELLSVCDPLRLTPAMTCGSTPEVAPCTPPRASNTPARAPIDWLLF